MASATPPAIPLPPPSTFDIIPSLHALLARLLTNPSDPSSTALTPKDLPAEIAAIKIKIQKAREAIERLPDMDRSVEEQEEEIKELEEKIAKQRDVLRKVAGAGEMM